LFYVLRGGLSVADGLGQQMTTMRRGIGRLIDSYAEGLIGKAEFEPRIAALKQRLSASKRQRPYRGRLPGTASRWTRPNPRPAKKPRIGNIVQTLVERFLAWINRDRRLAKDFEASIPSAAAFLYAAAVMLLIRRIARRT
jgi:hypothetical protein